MAEVLLFHHAHGLTEGIVDLSESLRSRGHTVHTPDLFDGRTFKSLDAGLRFAEEVGFFELITRGEQAAESLPRELVYAGISLGVLPAQKLAQTRAGARGALLVGSCVPVSEFSTTWPENVPVQVHGMDHDPFFVGEGDIDAARALVAGTDRAELILFPGDRHIFMDSSLPSYDAGASARLLERCIAFLATLDTE